MIDLGPNGQPLLSSNPADEGRDPCEHCGAPDTEECHEAYELQAGELPGVKPGLRILCDSCDEKRREEWAEDAFQTALHQIAKSFNIATDIHPNLIAAKVIAQRKP